MVVTGIAPRHPIFVYFLHFALTFFLEFDRPRVVVSLSHKPEQVGIAEAESLNHSLFAQLRINQTLSSPFLILTLGFC